MKNFFEATRNQGIYNQLLRIEKGSSTLKDILVEMQADRGVGSDEAEASARSCMEAVANYGSVRDLVGEDAPAVMDLLLRHIDEGDSGSQVLNKRKLHCGLAIYRDEEMVEQLNNGVCAEDLFWQFYAEGRDKAVAPDELDEAIRRELRQFRLPASVAAAVEAKLEASQDYLATAAALGENGWCFKCIATMDLYLNQEGALSMQEAANRACTSVEVQATADAVAHGMIDRETAKKVLLVLAVTAVIVGVGVILYTQGGIIAAEKTIAALENTTFLEMKLPPVFDGFPSYRFYQGNALAKLRAALEAAKGRQALGSLLSTAGIAAAALSGRAAEFLGSLSTRLPNGLLPMFRKKPAICTMKDRVRLSDCLSDEPGQSASRRPAWRNAEAPAEEAAFDSAAIAF